jgi:sucrose-6-phosphate hydrolase SacC (GH32 family)
MYYAPPGLCLNDFSVLATPDGWRLMHLQAPPLEPFDASVLETSYGLAQSTDLVNWQPLGPAFGIGRPGAFDDSAVWTMSQIPWPGGGLGMYYTGVTNRPRHRQSVGLAVSSRTDGTGWLRHGNGPIAEPDPRWYHDDTALTGWRDPYVVRDTDGFGCWVMLVCAHARHFAPGRAGCVGLALSDDLEHWQVQPPLIAPGDIDELECPVLERAPDGGWYLLGSIGPGHYIRAWYAEKLNGTWHDLGPVGPAGPYAPRLTDIEGQRVMLHTLQQRHDRTDTGVLGRGVLAPPKLWVTAPGTAPQLNWWPGLERHLDQPTDAAVHDACTVLEFDHPEIIELEYNHAGAGPLVVNITASRATVGYRGQPPLATAALRQPAARSLRVLRAAEFIEVFLDDRLIISALAYTDPSDAITAHVDGHPATALVRPIVRGGTPRDDRSRARSEDLRVAHEAATPVSRA